MSSLDFFDEFDAIAIVGMAGRFPGANTLDAFWQNLRNGVESITFFSDQELLASGVDSDTLRNPRYVKAGAILSDIELFDAAFFGFTSREAEAMDPQQRLLIECAWEALENSGCALNGNGGAVGVFVGATLNNYLLYNLYPNRFLDQSVSTLLTLLGNDKDYLATRISYALNLKGPCITVQTACSTSLVAVHLACQSLLNNECEIALAGGVSIKIPQKAGYLYEEGGLYSPDGHCRAFDAKASGTVFGSGAGIVALKRLSNALADGDNIFAIIRGSAINNDGATKVGYTAPSVDGQASVIAESFAVARVNPETITYIEAHGTGTPLGDPIEIAALTQVFRDATLATGFCAIGSVKTNVGHLETASGITGLIKATLALKHKQLPPSLGFEQSNPHIDFTNSPFYVNTRLSEWKSLTPRRAGVSSFGIGGTNAHIVLEEAPVARIRSEPSRAGAYILPLSARAPAALGAVAAAYVTSLITPNAPLLHHLCYTASTRRSHYAYRLALVAIDEVSLINQLKAAANGEMRPELVIDHKIRGEHPKVVFVFSGHGAQYVGMAQELLAREPIFHKALEACATAIAPYVDWPLLDMLAADETHFRLHDVDVVQPLLFAIQVALAALWRSWGIHPAAVVGQSMGEVAAAHVAGTLSLTDAARIICRRSQAVRRVSGQGAMAVVELSLAQAQQALAGMDGRVAVAVSMSPRSTVLSGEPTALGTVLAQLEVQGVFYRRIKVDYASHSPQMDSLRAELLHDLRDVRSQAGTIPIYSTVSGQASKDQVFDAEYWVANLREPVLFWPAVQQLIAAKHTVFVELSPHPLVLPAIQDALQHLGQVGVTVPSLRRGATDHVVMLETLGTLYTQGCDVVWTQLYPEGGQSVDLPHYPWQRERFWILDHQQNDRQLPHAPQQLIGEHPLLGRCLTSSVDTDTEYWETELNPTTLPYLADHRVQDTIVLPGAAYIEMALGAARQRFGTPRLILEKVQFQKLLVLALDQPQTVQLVLTRKLADVAQFRISSRSASQSKSGWTQHAEGTIRLVQQEPMQTVQHTLPVVIQGRCATTISNATHYQTMEMYGLEYGPAFQGIIEIWKCPREAIALIRLPEIVALKATAYQIHPALLDACFQVLGATISLKTTGGVIFPIGIDTLRVNSPLRPDIELWCHALLHKHTKDEVSGDVFLLDAAGQVLLEARGFHSRLLSADEPSFAANEFSDWLYEVKWQQRARRSHIDDLAQLHIQGGQWLILTDSCGVGGQLTSLLLEHGDTCIQVTPGEVYRPIGPNSYQLNPADADAFGHLLEDAFDNGRLPCKGIIHLWSLETLQWNNITSDTLDAAQELGCASVLQLLQAVTKAEWIASPRLWLVTCGAQAVEQGDCPIITQSPVWGLGSTIAHEHPELQCTCVDISQISSAEEIQSLLREFWSDEYEDRIALRNGISYVARLVRYSPSIDPTTLQPTLHEDASLSNIDQRPSSEPTTIKDTSSPTTQIDEPRLSEIGHITIQLHAICPATNNDSITAPLYMGCAGQVVAYSEDITKFHIGDFVIAVAPYSQNTSINVDVRLVIPKPLNCTIEQAAAAPVAFVTAYYALYYLGTLGTRERVLIHANNRSYIAAVLLAQQLGADVYVTANNMAQQTVLSDLAVHHILDSKSPDFAADLLSYSGDQGFDVVLNIGRHDHTELLRTVVAASGRLVEVDMSNNLQLLQATTQATRRHISVFAVEIAPLILERPSLYGQLLQAISPFLASCPMVSHPIEQIVGGSFPDDQETSTLDLRIPVAKVVPDIVRIRSDCTYLISGGIGGLGLTIAQWLIAQGARHLVLLGRSAPTPSRQEAIAALEAAGAQVVIALADVSQHAQVAEVLNSLHYMPSLRGVIHAAAILDDGIIFRLNPQRLTTVLAPKMHGAWNLHMLTLYQPLDFFVLFSSTASVLGSPGQGNYAAANAFLDGLAYYRRAQGLPGLSINWGPWAEVGLAAEHAKRGNQLEFPGFGSIPPIQGVQALDYLLNTNSAQIAVMRFNMQQWLEFYFSTADIPLLTDLVQKAAIAVHPPESHSRHSSDSLQLRLGIEVKDNHEYWWQHREKIPADSDQFLDADFTLLSEELAIIKRERPRDKV